MCFVTRFTWLSERPAAILRLSSTANAHETRASRCAAEVNVRESIRNKLDSASV